MLIVLSSRIKGYAIAALTLLFAYGCSEQPPLLQPWYDYQQRLAKPQQLAVKPWQLAPAEALPPLRDLRLPEQAINLSLLDSQRLNQCRLGALLAARNSSLGRLQTGLLRYYQDVQISSAIDDCLSQLGDGELKQRLQQLAVDKQQALPHLRAQAMLVDPALRNSLQGASQGLAHPDPAQLAPLLSALSVVLQTLESQHSTDLPPLDQLQQSLEVLEKSRYLSELWQGFHQQTQVFIELAPLLEGAVQRVGCDSAGVPERAQIMRTIAIQRFAGELQPQLALYQAHGQALQPYLSRLVALSAHPLLDRYLHNLLERPEQLREQVRDHAKLWQQLFQACGFSAGISNPN